VTDVVAILNVFGVKVTNSRIANPEKLLKKPHKWLNPKKKHIKGLYEPNSDASKRLLVKQKTIRVLLNTGLSGDLLFIKKDLKSTYLP
jgi:hypothetical protein